MHLAVVHVVMHGGVVPAEQPMPREPARHQFKAEVPADVHQGHVEKPDRRRQQVNRHHHRHKREDDRMSGRLQRVEAERRPRRGAVAAMVHAMHDAKKPRPMHQPMRPVEPGVVNQDQRRETEQKVRPVEVVEPRIQPRQSGLLQRRRQHAGGREDGERQQTEQHLSPHLRQARKRRLYLAAKRPPAKQHIEDHVGAARDQQVSPKMQRVVVRKHPPRVADELVEALHGDRSAALIHAVTDWPLMTYCTAFSNSRNPAGGSMRCRVQLGWCVASVNRSG